MTNNTRWIVFFAITFLFFATVFLYTYRPAEAQSLPGTDRFYVEQVIKLDEGSVYFFRDGQKSEVIVVVFSKYKDTYSSVTTY